MTMLTAADTMTTQQRDVARLSLLKRHSEQGTLGHTQVTSDDVAELLGAFEAPDLNTLIGRFRQVIATFNETVEPGIQLATLAGLNIADQVPIIKPDQTFGWRMFYAARALKMRFDSEGNAAFLWSEGIAKIVTDYDDECLS